MRLIAKKIAAIAGAMLLSVCSLSGCSGKANNSPVNMSAEESYTKFLAAASESDCKKFADTLYNTVSAADNKYITGSPIADALAELIRAQMERIGLTGIKVSGSTVDRLNVNVATLSRTDSDGVEISYNLTAYPNTNFSMIKAQIYDLGNGRESEFGSQAPGKIGVAVADSGDDVAYIVAQAQLHQLGALLIAISDGDDSVASTYTESAQRFTGSSIPVFSVSEADALTLLEESKNTKTGGTIEYTLVADTMLSRTVGKNIYGFIQGYDTQSNIMLTAAYDGLLYGYNTNACSVAAMLEIADAIIKSGVKPRCNIIFAAYCGSQLSDSTTMYTAGGGLYSLLNSDTDDFITGTCLQLDVALPSVKLNSSAELKISAGLEQWAAEQLEGFECEPYESLSISATDRADTPGYIFESSGVPTVWMADGYDESIAASDADTPGLYDARSLRFTLRMYGKLIYGMLYSALIPFDFSPYFADAAAVLSEYKDDRLAALGCDFDSLISDSESGAATCAVLRDGVTSVNSDYKEAIADRNFNRANDIYQACAGLNQKLLAQFARLQNNLIYFESDFSKGLAWDIALNNAILVNTALENAVLGRNTVAVEQYLQYADGMGYYIFSSADAMSKVYASRHPSSVYAVTWARNMYKMPDIGAGVCLLSENRKEDFSNEGIINALNILTSGAARTVELLQDALAAYRTAAGIFAGEGDKLAAALEEAEKDYK